MKLDDKPITLDDLYAVGFGAHDVVDTPDHKIANCPICQKIQELGRKMWAQQNRQARYNKDGGTRKSTSDPEVVSAVKKLAKKKLTPVEIATKLDFDAPYIRRVIHQNHLQYWERKKYYTLHKGHYTYMTSNTDEVAMRLNSSKSYISQRGCRESHFEYHGYTVDITETKIMRSGAGK